MTVGATVSQVEINSAAAQIARQVFSGMNNVQQMKAWLDTQIDADLIALGYTSGEVAILKSAFTDLDKIRQIFEGSEIQATQYDARTFSKLLLGIALY
jgi:hypothetical protein